MDITYIGTTPTLVRVDGVKRDIEPGETFEMEDKEGKELVEGHYRDLFIVAGTEPGDKQNPENNKLRPSAPKLEEEKPAKDVKAEKAQKEKVDSAIDELVKEIETTKSMDELNAISTTVAQDEALAENERVVAAIEKRAGEYLDVDENGVPKADAVANVSQEETKTEAPKAVAPKKNGKKKPKGKKKSV